MTNPLIDNIDFMEDNRGVHLMHGEDTMCGYAWDAWATEDGWEDGEMKSTRKKTVTCDNCIRVMELCAGVRYKKDDCLRRLVKSIISRD